MKNIGSRLRRLYAILTGESTKNVLKEVSDSTSDVCRRVDELLNRAQLDGEDEWFKRREKEKHEDSFSSCSSSCPGRFGR
jgi:hypothetical protein